MYDDDDVLIERLEYDDDYDVLIERSKLDDDDALIKMLKMSLMIKRSKC